MDTIPVPPPPRSAYNPNRRVSDLLLSQVKHFQHVEMKRGDLGISSEIARDVYTEGGAARYIAAVTRALRGTTATTAQPPTLTVIPTRRRAQRSPMVTSLATSSAKSSVPAKKASRPVSQKQIPAKTSPKKTLKKTNKRKS